MAPAADIPQATTLTHTEHVFQAAALVYPSTARKQRRTATATQTRVVTVTLAEDMPLSRGWEWPSHSHSPRPSTLISSVKTIASTNSPPSSFDTGTSRHSTYPRPSPPTFWYPETIVPRAAWRDSTTLGTVDARGRWFLPYGLLATIFLVVFLGAVWTLLSRLSTFPPQLWRWSRSTREEHQHRGWNAARKDRRPLDKPSKYAPESPSASSTSSDEPGNESGISTASTAAPTPRIAFSDHDGVELTLRTQHRRQVYRTGDRTCTAQQRSRSTPPSAMRMAFERGQATAPANPFLRPPSDSEDEDGQVSGENDGVRLQPRSSTEWLTARAAFFAPTDTATPTSPSPSQSPSPSPSLSTPNCCPIIPVSNLTRGELDTVDIEALEAGTAPLTPRRLTLYPYGHQKSKSWADMGFSRVEDTVNGWVGSLARWTDDIGGDEGLLLPMVRGDGMRKGVKVE